MDLSSLAGAFGSVVEPAATVAAKNAAAQQLGDFGVDPALNPFLPAPTAPPKAVGTTANRPVAETQAAQPTFVAKAMAFVKQYQRVILIGGGIALVVGLVLRRKRKK